jgi:6-phosphogluconolactonase/glucosamine-6-phosphate isomerase/deaminase
MINHVACVAFIAMGTGKVKILQNILDMSELSLPAARIWLATSGQLMWFMDNVALTEAKFVKSEFKL